MHDFPLHDRYRRRLNYLRVSVTDRCNLRCVYCVPRDTIPRMSHRDILRYEEILRIVRIGVSLGITKIRITGGEPLARKGAVDLLRRLAAMGELEDVSLTTNGVLLSDNIEKIQAAGIKRINISLDTLDPDRYREMTRGGRLEDALAGIEAARIVAIDGESVTWSQTGHRLAPGRHVIRVVPRVEGPTEQVPSAEALATLLWPEVEPHRARANLRLCSTARAAPRCGRA